MNESLLRARRFRRRCAARTWRGLFLPLRGAFEVAGAVPAAEFVGVASVFGAHDGVEVVGFLHAFLRETAKGGGVFHAALVAGIELLVGRGDVVEIALEVIDEGGGEFVRGEAGDEGGFRGLFRSGVGGIGEELREVFVAGGEEGGFAVVGGGEAVGEAGFVLIDGGGDAADIAEVEAKGVEEHFLGRGGAAALAGFGVVHAAGDADEIAGAFGGFARGGEVGLVVVEEGYFASEFVVAAFGAVVHGA